METERVAVVLVAAVAVAAAVIVADLPGDRPGADGEQALGEPGSVHRHAYLSFVVNGSERSLGRSYLERAVRVHFHQDDGILHVHADNVDPAYALDTMDITLNQTCLAFRPENTTLCSSGNRTVGMMVNGQAVAVESGLDREIEQGDDIVVWYGRTAPDSPDRELPPEYRETVPGDSV